MTLREYTNDEKEILYDKEYNNAIIKKEEAIN